MTVQTFRVGVCLLMLAICSAPQVCALPPAASTPAAVAGERVAATVIGLLDHGMTSFGAARCGDWLYVLGGYVGVPHKYCREDQSKAFFRIGLADPTRVEALPFDEAVQSVELVAVGDNVVRLGGMRAFNARGEAARLESVTTCALFDVDRQTWTELPALPAGRSSHAAVVVGTTIHVVGGWQIFPDSRPEAWHQEIWSLDLAAATPSWRVATQLPAGARRGLVALVIGENVVVAGGLGPDDEEPSALVEIWNTRTGQWRRGPDFPSDAFGVAAVACGDELLASGADGRVWATRIEATSWRYVGSWIFPRFFHRLIDVGHGDVLALGGISKKSRPRQIEKMALTPAYSKDAAIVGRWSIPYAGQAKNRQAVLESNGQIFLAGGNRSSAQHDFAPDRFSDEIWRLDLCRLEFERSGTLPAARQSMEIVSMPGGGALALGGFGHDGVEARAHASLMRADLRKAAWTEDAAQLPAARTQFGVARHAEKLWVFGGADYKAASGERAEFQFQDDVLCASTVGGTTPLEFVSAGTRLPRPRRAFAGALAGDQYYLLGGLDPAFKFVAPCDVFDLSRGEWSTIPSPARPRVGARLVPIDGRLYLVGGSSPDSTGDFEPNDEIEFYDPSAAKWTTLALRLPASPRHLLATAFRGQLLLLATDQGDATSIEAILLRMPSVAPVGAVENPKI
ncbi:MAG: hypothetical protein ACKVX7_15520 [Planctomycetota bacterium]